MKKICWICMAIIVLLVSCNKEPKDNVLQEIGVADCLEFGGTWNGNEFELANNCGNCVLSFAVKSAGILKFEHKKNEVIADHAFIFVGNRRLQRGILRTRSHYSYKKCNAGLVDKGDIITIECDGAPVKLKHIRIVAKDSFGQDDF